MSEREEFENNKVLLWGLRKASTKLLNEYDKGNKNPYSKKRNVEVVRQPKVKEVIKKEFNLDEDYTIDDLPFLNQEYDRIDKEISEGNDDLYDLQDKLYELIEGLEAMKKFKGNGIKKVFKEMINHTELKPEIKSISKGRGFKKGSPEAKAHAEKMRLAREAKKPKGEIIKKESKARVQKGSEEAKAIAKRLLEARKAKQELKKQNEVKEVKPKKGRPWYYIGDIPKGYREATEIEAIKNNKVSKYGKYEVDETRYMLYRDFDILLDENKSLQEVIWTLNALKKRVIKSLEEIEILNNKLENPKYDKNKTDNKNKLELEKNKKKYLQAGYNWYYKIYCEYKKIPYERQKITLPVKEIKINKSNKAEYIPKEEPIVIDPRTNKPIEKVDYTFEDKKKSENNKNVDVDLYFENNNDMITLSTKYFTPDYKLKPTYAKKLFDKKIILSKKHYTTDDYNKYFYHMKGGGIYKLIK